MKRLAWIARTAAPHALEQFAEWFALSIQLSVLLAVRRARRQIHLSERPQA